MTDPARAQPTRSYDTGTQAIMMPASKPTRRATAIACAQTQPKPKAAAKSPDQLRAETTDKSLQDIFRAARPYGVGEFLDRLTLKAVVEHRALFEPAHRENPGLLKLATTALWVHRNGPQQHADLIKWLKILLLDAGLSEATWRFVVRHGTRFLRPVFELNPPASMFRAAIYFLQTLQQAKLPPPPPRCITTHWLRAFNPGCGRWVFMEPGFVTRVRPSVIRSALLEADRRRRSSSLSLWIDEFLGVMHWVPKRMEIDKNQSKAGWPWLLRQWQTHELEQTFLAGIPRQSWDTRSTVEQFDDLTVAPIRTATELFAVAKSLRNCLGDPMHANDCAQGGGELLAVRDRRTDRTIGCIKIDYRNARPVVRGALGFANERPKGDFKRLVSAIVARLAAPDVAQAVFVRRAEFDEVGGKSRSQAPLTAPHK